MTTNTDRTDRKIEPKELARALDAFANGHGPILSKADQHLAWALAEEIQNIFHPTNNCWSNCATTPKRH